MRGSDLLAARVALYRPAGCQPHFDLHKMQPRRIDHVAQVTRRDDFAATAVGIAADGRDGWAGSSVKRCSAWPMMRLSWRAVSYRDGRRSF